MARQRIAWIDMAKGIAIICVIFGHCVVPGSLAKRLIYTFHMPLFFILAGYTFKPRSALEELRRSIPRLVIPYALLFLVGPVKDALGQAQAAGDIGLMGLLKSFIGGSGFDMPDGTARVGIAWFLIALFATRLLLCVITGLSRRFRHRGLVQGTLCALTGAAGVILGSKLHIWLPLSGDVAMAALPLMWCGMRARDMHLGCGARRTRDPRAAFATGAALVLAIGLWAASLAFARMDMAERSYRLPLLALTGSAAATYVIATACAALDHIAPIAAKPLSWVGRLSFMILCVHATDWVIPWTYLGVIANLPHPNFAAGILRSVYCVAWAALASRVAPAPASNARESEPARREAPRRL